MRSTQSPLSTCTTYPFVCIPVELLLAPHISLVHGPENLGDRDFIEIPRIREGNLRERRQDARAELAPVERLGEAHEIGEREDDERLAVVEPLRIGSQEVMHAVARSLGLQDDDRPVPAGVGPRLDARR